MRSDSHRPGTHALRFGCHEFGNGGRSRLGEGVALTQQYARILVRSNTSADMGFMRPLSPVERSVIMRGVDKVYTTFTRNVAAGRNLPLAKVLEIAQGRVWSGEDALGIGLIDTYGGLYAAIAIAADKAELGDDYRVTEVFDEPMDLPLLFQFFGAQLRSSFTRSELGDAMQTYEQIQEAVSQQGVVMYCPYRMDLEEQ